MRSYVVDQLEAWCRRYPARRKVLFVPSTQVGYNVTSALARSGAAWINLEVCEPHREAARFVAPRLQASGWRSLPPDGDVLLIQNQLPGIASDASGYFADAEWGSGLVQALVHTIRSLRTAGIGPGDLRGRMPGAKGSVIARCLVTYERMLAEERLYDTAHLLQEALEAKQYDSAAAYAILDETELPELAFCYVRLAAHDELLRIGRDAYVQSPPAHSAARRFSGQPRPPGAPRVQLGAGARILAGEDMNAPNVRTREALGPENEVRGVFRDLLERNIPVDQVEIAYTSRSPYLTLLVEAADSFHLAGDDRKEGQIAFAGGIPATLTHPGQALLGWLHWIEQGLDVQVLVGLCRAGLLNFEDIPGLSDPLDPQVVGNVLATIRMGNGRERYRKVLTRLRQEHEEALRKARAKGRTTNTQEDALQRVRMVQHIIEHLFALTPEASMVSMRDMSEACTRFLEELAAARSARDRRERRSLVERLEELGERLHGTWPLKQLARTLHELLTDHTGEAAVAKGGKLYVTSLEQAGYSGRPHLYIVGMDEGSFPGNPTEDPILLDDERARFDDRLTLQRKRPGDQQWHLERVLGRAHGSVTLSASIRHLADGQERRPSPVFHRFQTKGPRLTSIPAPPRALTDTELFLALREQEGVQQALDCNYPWLVLGYGAADARGEEALTRYDGVLSNGDGALDPLNGTSILSASRIEMLARCPYRYFLRYVLKVKVPDDEEIDPTTWLDPLQFGSLLHELFAEFMQCITDRGERVDPDRHETELYALLDTYIEDQRKLQPPPYEAAFTADCKRLRQAARIFLTIEAGREAEPAGFEVSFGFGQRGGLHHPDPVVIELGDDFALPLRGRIDRVDRTEDGYELWDYKTGSPSPYSGNDLLGKGRNLQWALYAYALEEIIRQRGDDTPVLRSGYVFTSDRGHGRRVYDTIPLREQLAERLGPLFELARHGVFPHVHATDGSGNECTFCDFKGLCEEESIQGRTALKDFGAGLDDSASYTEALRAWITP